MRKSSLRRLVHGCSLVAAISATATASADWPTPRHNPRRTGVSTTGSDIQKPAAYWRAYLGGALGSNQIYVGDVDDDGNVDVLYLAGGDLTLARPDGTVLWRTTGRGYVSIVNVVDLDLDGQLDVVAYNGAPSQVSVINAVTGKIEWVEPAGEIGTPGAFRVGDLDGDGSPDLWLDTCGCCAVESGSPGILYSFASGFGAPAKLGTPPPRAHCRATSNTLADLDGDGRVELVHMGEGSATAFRGDGTIVATSGTIPAHAFAAQCEAADLDGQPGDELICFNNTVYAGAGERGLFALAYRPGKSPSLELLWHQAVSAADGGDARAPAALAVDLDGDGRLEATVSGKANGVFTTSVFDAATGASLATVDGIVAGDVPAAAPGQRWILVGTDTGVRAFSFSRNPPGLNPAWQLPDQRVIQRFDWARARRSGSSLSLLTPDLDGDARPDLVLGSSSEPMVLTGLGTAGGTPAVLGKYALDPGVGASVVGVPTHLIGTPKLFVARTDGFVTLLDGGLAAVNLQKDGVATAPGMSVGGYFTGSGAFNSYGRTPIAGKLQPGDAADGLLVVDSRGDLVRIDPTGATNVAPAKPAWRLQDTFGAAMRPAGTGPATIGAFRRRHPVTDPPVFAMVVADAEGKEVAGLALQRQPQHDVLPGDLVGDGSTAFVALGIDSSLQTDITVMSASGQQLWQQKGVATAGTQPLAVADWDGDGAADVAAVINTAHVYSGKSGTEIATGADAISYAMPILASVDADPALEMVIQGAYIPARALDHDLTSMWASSGPLQPYPYGALAPCGSGLVLAEGNWSVSAQLTLTQASGASAGTSTSVVLASGAAYPDVASATAAGAMLGQLGDAAVSTDLDGTGLGSTVLVGSTDGYLYAVDACAGTLRWALAFGVPVGAPILADTDGDGKDEILVSVADGYLYALKNEVVPAPDFVWDTDPPHGITSSDVQDIETTKALYAAWAPVAGATSYEVAVVSAGGTYVTSPSWIDVGPASVATIPDLPLVDGAKYFVGVRAVSSKGKSPDKPSNGVVVHSPGAPDGGPGGTGGTTTSSTSTTTTSSTSSTTTGGEAGAGGAPPDILVSGRACTCSTPGAPGDRWFGLIGLLAAIAAAFARRR